MIEINCRCPKCKIKYIMYIPNRLSSDKKIKEYTVCACGHQMKYEVTKN